MDKCLHYLSTSQAFGTGLVLAANEPSLGLVIILPFNDIAVDVPPSILAALIDAVTLSVYLIFRIIFFINSKLEEEYINIYLIMNSVDAFLLPLSFFINHRIYKYFCCCCPKIKYQRDTNDYDNDNDSSIRDGINLDSL